MVAKNFRLGYDDLGLNKLGGFAMRSPEDDEDEDEDGEGKREEDEGVGGDSGWIDPPEENKFYICD